MASFSYVAFDVKHPVFLGMDLTKTILNVFGGHIPRQKADFAVNG